ncbi:MAG: hypothetical protein U0T73_03355 [Chitinophagales bacterium]
MAKKRNSSFKKFPGKLLLFGEHLINRGARALAVPSHLFEGHFQWNKVAANDTAIQSSNELLKLANYLVFDDKLAERYDTTRLLTDIENGLYFESTIPQGYGMGSSGALVAAVAESYRKQPLKKNDWTAVKTELANIERFFHGKSSGLDPLVSFLEKSVIIEKAEVKEVFDLKTSEKPMIRAFLIDTGMQRQTAPWVDLFLKKCGEPSFEKIVDGSLVKASDICIQSFLNQKYPQFWKSLQVLSQMHYDAMPEFIPEPFQEVWQTGLRTGEYYLKICGAGGGGFILGFYRNQNEIVLPGSIRAIPVLRF